MPRLLYVGAIVLILLFAGRDMAYAVPPDPVLDSAGISIKGDGGEDIQFGNIAANHPIEANVTAQLNSTQFKVSTNWFAINASLLAPTVILNWAYNYTYKFVHPWINNTSPVGFGSRYSQNYLVNVSTISTGLKFYEVAGTYITSATAQPHYYAANQTLKWYTNGNPTLINVYSGTNGAPTAVYANGSPVTLGSGYTYSAGNKIVAITHTGTRFSITWQSLTPATEKVTVSMQGSAPAQTVTVSGCSPSIGSFSADGTQHTFTATASCSITFSLPVNASNSYYVFIGSGNHGAWTYTTTSGGGTDTVSNTLNILVSETASYSVVGGGSPSAPTLMFTQNTVATTFTVGMSGTAKLMDYSTAWSVTPNPLSPSTGTEQWIAASGTSGTSSAGGTINPAFQHQYSLTMAASPSNCGSTAPAVGSTWENSGASVGGVSATPVAGCTFSTWTGTGSGSYSGSNNPTSITMSAHITETAGFTGSPSAPSSCTQAQQVVNATGASFTLLISLFFVMAGGTVVTAFLVFTSRDASIILPLAFIVLLLGTVIILVAILFGAASVANNNTLYGIGCTPQ